MKTIKNVKKLEFLSDESKVSLSGGFSSLSTSQIAKVKGGKSLECTNTGCLNTTCIGEHNTQVCSNGVC